MENSWVPDILLIFATEYVFIFSLLIIRRPVFDIGLLRKSQV
jgi:hypothetical protein